MMNWRWVEIGVQTETHEPGKTMSSRQNVALRSRRSAGHTTNYFEVKNKSCTTDIECVVCQLKIEESVTLGDI